MSTKHTPGTWRCAKRASEVDSRYYSFAILYGPAGTQLATVDGLGKASMNNEANARLIAAAPELLAAMQAALPLLEGFEDDDMHEDDEAPIVAPILAQARAAIAKAEGRS